MPDAFCVDGSVLTSFALLQEEGDEENVAMDAEPTHSNAQSVLSGAPQSTRRSTPYDANTGVKFQPAAKAGAVRYVVLCPAL
jgi:hypothetical protein